MQSYNIDAMVGWAFTDFECVACEHRECDDEFNDEAIGVEYMVWSYFNGSMVEPADVAAAPDQVHVAAEDLQYSCRGRM